MAWDVVSKATNTGLLSSEVNQLQLNFTALAQQNSGAPTIVISYNNISAIYTSGVYSWTIDQGYTSTGFSTNNLFFVRFGAHVHFQGRITLDGAGTDDGNDIIFGNLPFTAADAKDLPAIAIELNAAAGAPANYGNIYGRVSQNTDQMTIRYNKSNFTASAAVVGSEGGTSFSIRMAGSYMTAE